MNRKLFVFGLLISLLATPSITMANGCFEDPIYTHEWVGLVTTSAFVRDVACMEDSEILTTVPEGDYVMITGETDGWWRVQLNDGTAGWVGQTLIEVVEAGGDEEARADEEASLAEDEVVALTEDLLMDEGTEEALSDFAEVLGTELLNTIEAIFSEIETQADLYEEVDMPDDLFERIEGRILLQVEKHGEAWYMDPETRAGYYMKDGPTAYEMMRAFGLGVSEQDYARMLAGDNALLSRLQGRIILRVQEHGEAYYIHPDTQELHYLRDGDEAYRIMRELSLGVSEQDFAHVARRQFEALGYENGSRQGAQNGRQDSVLEEELSDEVLDEVIRSQEILEDNLISADEVKQEAIDHANAYWLSKVNALREDAGLRLLETDERFIETAMDYADYMAQTGSTNHERADGSTMHDWIDQQGLTFTVRYSDGGWETNYFTENIAWSYVDNSQESVEEALDNIMDWYLAEASYNGAHYRTQYYPDWNSLGVGVAFEYLGNDQWKGYFVFHYGSLLQE